MGLVRVDLNSKGFVGIIQQFLSGLLQDGSTIGCNDNNGRTTTNGNIGWGAVHGYCSSE
jgi:hypothetical protein